MFFTQKTIEELNKQNNHLRRQNALLKDTLIWLSSCLLRSDLSRSDIYYFLSKAMKSLGED